MIRFVLDWWNGPVLAPSAVPVAMFCAICGAMVLSLFTRGFGFGIIVFNTAVLFLGAYGANVLMAGLDLPLDYYFMRPVVISFAGMLVTALLVLAILARGGYED
ncbi:MAG: hypothetical protein U1E16_10690 [Hyphomicrobiales bacterium]